MTMIIGNGFLMILSSHHGPLHYIIPINTYIYFLFLPVTVVVYTAGFENRIEVLTFARSIVNDPDGVLRKQPFHPFCIVIGTRNCFPTHRLPRVYTYIMTSSDPLAWLIPVVPYVYRIAMGGVTLHTSSSSSRAQQYSRISIRNRVVCSGEWTTRDGRSTGERRKKRKRSRAFSFRLFRPNLLFGDFISQPLNYVPWAPSTLRTDRSI